LVAACCVNGGTWLPGEILIRFPRFIQRMLAMVGTEDVDRARSVLEAHTLPQAENHIACPLLVLHGDADRLFSHTHAEEVANWAPSTDKRVGIWEGGDHCVYNHSAEKHALVADWFATKL
jgi:pimeloyl-ACP methyl ester carboxylesterase